MRFPTRQLTADDWAEFWPMLKDMGTDDDADQARPRYEMLVQDPRWGILGAQDGDRLVGYAAVQDYGPHLRLGDMHRLARLHDLYVLPRHRRRGVGTSLLEAAKTWTAEHARYLEWQAGEHTSAPFYTRLGYTGEPCPQPEYPTFVIDFQEE
ncbi:MAG TPA: GNAT family N-acetyltransferase [Mycobacteriales bacterium]|nr:GNAT family N-acetyltransferase [Mycobacteriales bacterium]